MGFSLKKLGQIAGQVGRDVDPFDGPQKSAPPPRPPVVQAPQPAFKLGGVPIVKPNLTVAPAPPRTIPVPQTPVSGVTPVPLTQTPIKAVPIQTALNTARNGIVDNTVMPVVHIATNTVKGNIVLPAKEIYQQEIEHNQAAADATQARIAGTDLQGVGGAAAVPAYVLANKMAGNNPELLKENLSVLGLTPKDSLAKTALVTAGDTLDSTAPLGLKSLVKAPALVQAGKDAAETALSHLTPLDENGSVQIPKVKASKTMVLGKPGVKGSSVAIYHTDDPGLDQIMKSSIIAAKGTAKTAEEHASALTDAGLSKADIKAIRNYAVANAGEDGAVEQNGLRSFIENRLEPPAPTVTPTVGKPPETLTPTPTAHTTELQSLPGTTPKTLAAAQKIADLYNRGVHSATDVNNLLNKNIGRSQLFSRAGNELEKAMAEEFTPAERTAVRDNLEGVAGPGEASTKVVAATHLMQQLNEYGYKVLDETNKSPVHRVNQYATRSLKSSVKSDAPLVERAKGNIKDLFNVTSVFAKNRQIKKFVSEDGKVRYGTQKEAGLTTKDGKLTGGGKTWTPSAVSTKELKQAGYNYEDDYGTLANKYHTSVGRVKAANDSVTEIKRDPERYGLTMEETKGLQPITKVPELEGYFAKPSVAKAIDEKLGYQRKPTMAERAWQGFNNGVIQSIVFNPLIHGRNLNELAGLAIGSVKGGSRGAVAGASKLAAYADYASMGSEARAALHDRMFEGGVVRESYGRDRATVLTKAMDAAGLPHITKINSAAMSNLDWDIRSSLFHNLTTGGKAVSDEAAARVINDFLGDGSSGGAISKNVGMFWGYLRTRGRVLKAAGSHPIANRGIYTAFAVQAATLYGVTKAFQDWTGNPNATVGNPGMFGLINEAKNLKKNGIGTVTQNVNPVVTAIANQGYGHDLFTKQDITGDRTGNLISTLVGPAQDVSKVSSGKNSPAQEALKVLTTANLPHAKGDKAAPKVSAFNTKGAVTETSGDPTGYKQQITYFNNLDKLKATFKGDTHATDALNTYLDRSHDPTTGATIQNSPAASMENAGALATNGKLLGAVQSFEKSQPSHDPVWDLPSDKLTTLMTYRAQLEGSADKSNILSSAQNGTDNWITDTQKASSDFYNNLPKKPGSIAPISSSPAYPTFDPDTTSLMATYSNASTTQKAALEQQYGGELSSAFNQIAQWTNQMRVAQTGKDTPKIRDYPQADAQTQQVMNIYNALPKGDGKNGTSPERSAWISANPALYAKMQSYLTAVSLNSLITQAAKAQFAGTEPSQQLLKDIKNVGSNDIATTAGPSGAISGYAVNPELAYTQNNAGNSAYEASYASNKVTKYLGNADKFTVKPTSGKFSVAKPKVTLTKASNKKFKVKSAKPKKVTRKVI